MLLLHIVSFGGHDWNGADKPLTLINNNAVGQAARAKR